MACLVGIEYQQGRAAALLVYGYWQQHYADAYLHGEVFGFLITLPWVAKQLPKLATYLKADQLFALLART